MNFSSKQLSDDKWGIFSGPDLLATVSCPDICQTVLSNLASGRTDAPATDVNALYQAPELTSKLRPVPSTKYHPLVKRSYRTPVSKLKTKRASAKTNAKNRSSQQHPLKVATTVANHPTATVHTNLAEGA